METTVRIPKSLKLELTARGTSSRMIVIVIAVSVGEQHGRKVVSAEKDGHRLMDSYELTHDLQTGYIRLGTDNSAIPPASSSTAFPV